MTEDESIDRAIQLLEDAKLLQINALSYCRRALYADAANARAWYHLGHILQDLGRHAAALRAFKACARFAPRKKEYSDFVDISRYAIRRVKVELETEYLKSGYTPLVHAAYRGDLTVLRKSIAAEEDPDAPDEYGTTPLCAAANHGKTEYCRALLEKGADVNRPDSCGRTALMFAASSGHEDIVTLLLEHGADVHPRDKWHHSALWNSIYSRGNFAICRLLIEHGADIEEVYDNEDRPLLMAVIGDHDETAEFLLAKGADIRVKNKQGSDALKLACYRNNLPMTAKLIDLGADVNTANEYGHTPLMQAAENLNVELVSLLLKHGADPHRKTQYGDTALGSVQRFLEAGERNADYAPAAKIAAMLQGES